MDFGIRWPNSVYNGIIAKCREILETSFIIMIQSDARPISWMYIDVSTFLLRILFEFKGVFFFVFVATKSAIERRNQLSTLGVLQTFFNCVDLAHSHREHREHREGVLRKRSNLSNWKAYRKPIFISDFNMKPFEISLQWMRVFLWFD